MDLERFGYGVKVHEHANQGVGFGGDFERCDFVEILRAYERDVKIRFIEIEHAAHPILHEVGFFLSGESELGQGVIQECFNIFTRHHESGGGSYAGFRQSFPEKIGIRHAIREIGECAIGLGHYGPSIVAVRGIGVGDFIDSHFYANRRGFRGIEVDHGFATFNRRCNFNLHQASELAQGIFKIDFGMKREIFGVGFYRGFVGGLHFDVIVVFPKKSALLGHNGDLGCDRGL